MRILNLQDISMLSAARGRMTSLKWRTAMGFLFACAAGLVLNSALIAFGWYALLCAAMGADYVLGARYVGSETGKDRILYGALFVSGSAASIIIYAGMAGALALLGGPQGVVIALLMAASSLVALMLFMFQAPRFMLIMAAPSVLCLMAVPFSPFTPGPAGGLESAAGVAFAVAAFMAYVARSARSSGSLFAGLEQANRVSRERQAEAEARQIEAEEASRSKGEFLTTMTHELRTPLNAVIGYSEIIQEDLELDGRGDLAGDARRITAAARHLLGLIDQVLQLTKIDSGRSHVELGEVDVRALIETAAAQIEPLVKANQNRLATRIAPEVGLARTDGEKLAVCVGHLLSNAAKFTSSGLVAVSAECERLDGMDWLRIAISDTGAGMTVAQIEKAFEPFTQIDGSKTRAQGGMGLGLSITSRTVKLLRGELAAVSEPGAGSTFTIRLPLRLNDDCTFQTAKPAAASQAQAPLGAVA
jgi:signal transduction histidine kinase